MKARLEFDLPDERDEHQLALDAGKWKSVVYELDQAMRSHEKYGTPLTIEELRKKLWYELEDNGLLLD